MRSTCSNCNEHSIHPEDERAHLLHRAVDDHNDEDYAQRLKKIMDIHRSVFINKGSESEPVDITQFLGTIYSGYNMTDFQNDFDRYLLEETKTDDLSANQPDNQPMTTCDAAECISKSRVAHNDNKQEQSLSAEQGGDRRRAYHQIFDSVHCHLYHPHVQMRNADKFITKMPANCSTATFIDHLMIYLRSKKVQILFYIQKKNHFFLKIKLITKGRRA